MSSSRSEVPGAPNGRRSSSWTRSSCGLIRASPAVPWRKNHLDDKTKELMYIAVDAAATHLYVPGIRQHIRAALKAGATRDEIMEVLELTSTLGIHAMNIGVPVLVEVLVEKGMRTGPAELTDYQETLKAEFTKTRGYWHAFWDEMLELDPELFAAYTEFSSVPWRSGPLSPKVKEFVYIAFDTAATHLYVKGLKLHIENAIGYGATPRGDPGDHGDRKRTRYARHHDRCADPGRGSGAARGGWLAGYWARQPRLAPLPQWLSSAFDAF